MTSATQAYRYAAPSSLVDGRLGSATFGGRALSGPAVTPRFFSGVVPQAAPAGFSGEGAVLDLATDEAENDADVLGMLLNFEPEVEIGLPADGSCTREWWWDHRGSRGPCEHVPAARIVARAAVEVSR
ncbi:hypothetical protein [Streptosporangium sp. 'caverna']|uniref:hypothetical protein n=1 Tax=Streptosporangium sp. 'caverna' TaxID=2202249 RepID=UPI00195503F2|nr:hypothetical protein [Streptosporangium sp. 'caverna']